MSSEEWERKARILQKRGVDPAYQLAQAPLGGGIVPPPAAQAETERRAAALPWGGAGADGMAIGALGGVIGIAMFRHSDSSRASGQ